MKATAVLVIIVLLAISAVALAIGRAPVWEAQAYAKRQAADAEAAMDAVWLEAWEQQAEQLAGSIATAINVVLTLLALFLVILIVWVCVLIKTARDRYSRKPQPINGAVLVALPDGRLQLLSGDSALVRSISQDQIASPEHAAAVASIRRAENRAIQAELIPQVRERRATAIVDVEGGEGPT